MQSGIGAMVRHGAVLVVLATSLTACGFLAEVADPPSPPRPTTSPQSRTPVEAPAEPAVVASVSLSDDRDLPGAPLRAQVQVTVHAVEPGLPPLEGRFAGDCGFAADAARFVAVDLTFRNSSRAVVNVGADLSLLGAPEGTVGLFTESGAPDVRYCHDGDRAPVTDHVVLYGGVGEVQTVSTYLVTDDPATTEPARGVTLALTTLRNTAMGTSEAGVWTVSGVGDGPPADAVSVPLG
jgi:hypothetical protein